MRVDSNTDLEDQCPRILKVLFKKKNEYKGKFPYQIYRYVMNLQFSFKKFYLHKERLQD